MTEKLSKIKLWLTEKFFSVMFSCLLMGFLHFSYDWSIRMERKLDKINAAVNYMDTDKIEHVNLYATCQRQDANIEGIRDTIIWYGNRITFLEHVYKIEHDITTTH
jgi:hypothetical protein